MEEIFNFVQRGQPLRHTKKNAVHYCSLENNDTQRYDIYIMRRSNTQDFGGALYLWGAHVVWPA